MNYAEQLQSSRWQMLKNRILAENNCRCQHCGRSDARMEVHHVHYIKGRMAWEYPDVMMMCLCCHCHNDWHAEHKKAQNALAIALKMIPATRVYTVAARLMTEAMKEIL